MSVYIHSSVRAATVFAESDSRLLSPRIFDSRGNDMKCPVSERAVNGTFRYRFDASGLSPWSPSTPVLFRLVSGDLDETFGFCELETLGNSLILLNGKPFFMRGYIRGIVAHEHPNMTGGSLTDAAVKNIRQAKKYGFNLVRWHSTVPDTEFVEAADREGLLIHMETGFACRYDEKGNKVGISCDGGSWESTILKYRNHPSAASFCIGNEMHKSGHVPEVKKLYELGRRLAPGKLIMDNSGWGEYDRSTADVFSQHIAYYFPYKHHAGMFCSDDCWRINGSAYDAPLEGETKTQDFTVEIRREAVPVRPVLAHEAVHYIDIPDYEALNAKYDAFAKKVGESYLAANGIRKPRYMTALPELVRRKNLESKMPDYIAGSQVFKKFAVKTYLERLRLSGLCGYEMLQFADTLKYENKNGIVDCFDDDKFIDPQWMLSFNADCVLLADFPTETYFAGNTVPLRIFCSDFAPEHDIRGDLTVTANGREVWRGNDFVLVPGLHKLADVFFKYNRTGAVEIAAEFRSKSGFAMRNSWKLWFYPEQRIVRRPVCGLENRKLLAYILSSGAEVDENVWFTDVLDDRIFDKLRSGKTVILNYHRDNPLNRLYWPGALERYKPCIWDRGSNLGGIISSDYLRNSLISGRYFEQNLQPLLEGGYKVCLDGFPGKPLELVSGIDKPVRDRMKGLISGVKDFIPEDTLRNFSHMFSLKTGSGLLIVVTFELSDTENPVVRNFLAALLNMPEKFETADGIGVDELKKYLETETKKGVRREDIMNHFWEIDNKPVEDTLFWEQAGIDLTKLS